MPSMAHSAGIIHRDVKPANFDELQVKIGIPGKSQVCKDWQKEEDKIPGIYDALPFSHMFVAKTNNSFAFAFVAWEILTRKSLMSWQPSVRAHWTALIQLKRPDFPREVLENPEIAGVVQVIMGCWTHNKAERLEMSAVLAYLHKLPLLQHNHKR